MRAESSTIDHYTLSRLVEAGSVQGAHVIGQIGGWGVMIKYGTLEQPLSATRSKKIRTFKKLETLVTYLKEIGISCFDVDATGYDKSTVQTYTRPDRSSAMDQTHESVEHDKWFREQVAQALQETDDPDAVWIPQAEVKIGMQRQRESLLARIEKTD
jgi:hypothetical protein